MFCTKCGTQLDDKHNFCSCCGAPTPNAAAVTTAQPKRLMRSRTNKKIAGVCGGLAAYMDVDPTLVRVIWLVLAFLPFPGAILAYIIAWIAMPKEDIPHYSPGQLTPSYSRPV